MLEPTGHSRQQKQRRNVLVTDKSCSLLLGGTRETLCRGNIQSSEREYRFKISLLLHLYLQWNLVVCNQVVRKSIVGLGTDEDSLTRAIVTRADIDMKKIKEEYRRYGTSINDDIKGDTSGYYMKFLLALVGWAIPWFEGLIDFMFAATQLLCPYVASTCTWDDLWRQCRHIDDWKIYSWFCYFHFKFMVYTECFMH